MMRKWLIATSALLAASCLEIGDFGKVTYEDFQSSQAYQGERRIEAVIEMSVGEMRLQPGDDASLAYQLDLRYNMEQFEPSVDYSSQGGSGSLNFRLKKEGGFGNSGKNELDIRLNPKAALDLRVETGVGESIIDLSKMKVERIDLQSGVGATQLTMLTPNPVRCRRVRMEAGVGALEAKGLGNLNFDKLEFEGGVGGAELDFSGAWENAGSIEIEVGVGGVEIHLPRELGVRLRAPESFLSGLDLDDFEKESEGRYRSYNLDQVDKVVSIELETGIGGVSIEWI